MCATGEFTCNNSVCVPGGKDGVICNGVNDCGDMSDELNCGKTHYFVGLNTCYLNCGCSTFSFDDYYRFWNQDVQYVGL